MIYTYTRPRYQVSVYITIGPLVWRVAGSWLVRTGNNEGAYQP